MANEYATERDSVNALAMTFFGRIHNLPNVSHQGDLLYSKAILQLAGKLNSGSEALSTPVLRAILTLAIHEVSCQKTLSEKDVKLYLNIFPIPNLTIFMSRLSIAPHTMVGFSMWEELSA